MNPQVPTDFHFFPVQASSVAGDVDALYLAMVALSTFFCIAIPAAIIYFSVKYRRRPGNEHGRRVETSKALEMTWTIIPFFIVIGMFFWGSHVFFLQTAQDPNAIEIMVTGKKWMWKYQHRNGRREIQDLHLPVNTPIRLKMASEDVLHCVYIPAFRVKQDVMPGRYTYLNFTPTKTGVYHLFCNQYCGTSHSNMIGKVVVMEQGDYQNWLGGYTGDPPEKVGEALFTSLACNTCHTGDTGSRGPLLNGIAGSKVALQGGNTVVADDTYLRESILNPQAKIVAGYQPIMPSFQGVVSQDQVNALIAYIKAMPAGTDTQKMESTAAVGVSEGTVAPPADTQQPGVAESATLPSPDGAPASTTAPDSGNRTGDSAPSPANNNSAPVNTTTPTGDQPASRGEQIPPTGAAPENAAPNENTQPTNAATTAGEAPGQAPAPADAQTTPGEQQGVQ
jgi:cytochrome c oxidase subunit 2